MVLSLDTTRIATVPNGDTMIDPTSNKVASVIPFKELSPSWHVPSAKIPEYMRWLVSWVGGPKGFVNPSLGRAVRSDNFVLGYMHLPVGQRQEGLHYHSITEIYVIVKGEVESFDPTGSHTAGPLDCLYIPPGSPHGVRNVGSEDVELIWLHDGVEAKGVTVYCHSEEQVRSAPSQEPVTKVSYADLAACWTGQNPCVPPYLHWSINWVGGLDHYENYNPQHAVSSFKTALGATVILPGNKIAPHTHDVAEVYVILRGKGIINLGRGNRELGHLDGVYFPPGVVHSLSNYGDEPLYVLWATEAPVAKRATVDQG